MRYTQTDVADHLLDAGDVSRVGSDLIQCRPASRYAHQVHDSVYCLDSVIDVGDIAVAQHLETQLGRYFHILQIVDDAGTVRHLDFVNDLLRTAEQ